MDLQTAALVRSELRSLAAGRPTGTPASFQRPPRAASNTPAELSSKLLIESDGSRVGAAASKFRRARVHAVCGQRSAAALSRPQSAPAAAGRTAGGSRSAPHLGSTSSYLPLKRRHFPSELRADSKTTTQLGAGIATTGVAITASYVHTAPPNLA